MGTRREKIIETATKLFNEKGCINTSTRHIAEELGISVGNLYYYFKNKEEIIIAIYEEFMSILSEHFDFAKEDRNEAFDFYTFIKTQMQIDIKYRFISVEILALYQNFPKVKKVIEKNLELKKEEMTLVFKHQMKYGYMFEKDDDELEFIRANTWLIGSHGEIYWVFNGVENEDERIKRSILGLLYFMKPYITKKGFDNSNFMKSIETLKQEIKNV